MKRHLWALGLFALAACGSMAEDTRDGKYIVLDPAEGTSWDGSPLAVDRGGLAEVAPLAASNDGSQHPWRVVRAELPGGQSLEVVAIYEPRQDPNADIEETTYLMRYHGILGVPDPMAILKASNPFPLTMAETYTGLTGKVAPNELLTRQALQASALGRPPAFVTPAFDPSVFVDEKASGCANGSNITPPQAGHHYAAPQNFPTVFFCPVDSNITNSTCPFVKGRVVTKFTCSGIDNPGTMSTVVPGRGVPGPTACPRVAGWIHFGFCPTNAGLDPSAAQFTAQEFFGPSTKGDWFAFAAFPVTGRDFYTDDWDATNKRAISGVFSSQDQTQQFAVKTATGMVVPN
jgi:hypothetical protein